MDDKILDHFLKELKPAQDEIDAIRNMRIDCKFLSMEEYCALRPGFHKDMKIWIDVPVIPEVKKPKEKR